MTSRQARRLELARVGIGLIFLLRTTPLLVPLRLPLGADTVPLLGWPTREWTVAVAGLSMPSAVVAALCVIRTIAVLLFTCGVRVRAMGILAAAAGYLVLAQNRFAFINSLHVLFLATFILALTAAPAPVASSVSLIRLFLASVYFWAGVAKVQYEWLSGHALEIQARAGSFAGPLGGWVDQTWLRSGAALAVPVVELTLAALLITDRRRHAIVLALAFHVVIELTVNPDTLGWQMAALLIAIWPSPVSPLVFSRTSP